MRKETTRRLLGLVMLVATVALCAAWTQAGSSAGSALSCGLGLPPGAIGFAEAEARQALEARTNGYVRVCDANLDRFRIVFSPLPAATAKLAFQPVDLSGTPFAQFASLGGASESVSDVRSRLYRGFRTPEGHTITLFEHDMSADGTWMARNPKDEPERIHGLPARLDVFQTPAGKAISHLSWVEHRRGYALWTDGGIAGTPRRAQLLALAAALPRSVPACPNERSRSFHIGPDGLPITEPAPASMTMEEMHALADESTRPCK